MKIRACFIIFIIAALSGCAKNTKSIQNRAALNRKNGTVIINRGKEKTYTGQNEIKKQDKRHEIAEDRAETIANEINRNPQIKKAAVVVTGNTAIVGITLNEDLSDGKLIELKRQVEKTVKKIDLEIDHVAVSSAPDLYSKIFNASSKSDKEKEELRKNESIQKKENILFQLIPTI